MFFSLLLLFSFSLLWGARNYCNFCVSSDLCLMEGLLEKRNCFWWNTFNRTSTNNNNSLKKVTGWTVSRIWKSAAKNVIYFCTELLQNQISGFEKMQAQHICKHVPKVTGEVYLSVCEVWMSFMKCAASANKVFSTRAARDFHECMRENVWNVACVLAPLSPTYQPDAKCTLCIWNVSVFTKWNVAQASACACSL